MEELVRCPNCGASNPRSAQWCGQCQRPFATPERAPEPVADALIGSAVVPTPPTAPPAATARADTKERGPFTVGEQGVTWTCASCGSSNPLDLPVCGVCGASFKDTVEPDEQLPERDPNTTVLVSFAFPGAGFAYLKRWPEAIGRAVVGTFAIAVAVIAGIFGTGSTAAIIGIIYGFATFALWAISSHDAYRVAQHQEALVILKPRVLLYVLLGLLTLFLVILVGSVIGKSSSR